jgi:hypothetical protein
MSKTTLMTLAAFVAVAAFSGLSKADVTNIAYDDEGNRMPLSCHEAAQAAWFQRQLELTDGDTSPAVPVASECSRELIANLAAEVEESK